MEAKEIIKIEEKNFEKNTDKINNDKFDDICEYSLDELKEIMVSIGEKPFRARQIYEWLHKKLCTDFDEMNNLPKALRDKLKGRFLITVMKPAEVLVSNIDGTRKYIYELYDGNVIEAVLMRYHHGNSVCISSQVGCRMGCRFCASTIDGCVRNLTAAEMLAEVYRIEKDTGERVSNVVMMGSGEPLDNYEASLRFIKRISSEDGLNISQRNITLSTCGIIPKIRELAEEKLQITLAISLHAPNQHVREEIMPIAKAYHLKELMDACRFYYRKTGRRMTYEYSVVKGVNDNEEEARQLSKLLSGMHGHVNLIPVNPIKEREYESPDRKKVEEFREILESNNINATIRIEMGRDINSACGQLRRRYIANAGSSID